MYLLFYLTSPEGLPKALYSVQEKEAQQQQHEVRFPFWLLSMDVTYQDPMFWIVVPKAQAGQAWVKGQEPVLPTVGLYMAHVAHHRKTTLFWPVIKMRWLQAKT